MRFWEEKGLFGPYGLTQGQRRRGAPKLLTPDQQDILEQYLLYRSWLLPRRSEDDERTIYEIITGCREEIARGRYEGTLELLEALEESVENELETLQAEIQRLRMQLVGDDPEGAE